MTAHFSLITGKPLLFSQQLTSRYNCADLKGLSVYHTPSSFGDIELQEYTDEFVSIRKVIINWVKPERLICTYSNTAGIHTRIPIDKPIHEHIKGAGGFHLKPESFSLLAGSSWTGLLSAFRPGRHVFIDIGWSRPLLNKLLNEEDPLKHSVEQIVERLPTRIITPPNTLNSDMRLLLQEIIATDFSDDAFRNRLHTRLSRFFKMMMEESVHFEAKKRKMKEIEWLTVHVAKQMIENNLDKQFTTADISKTVGLNEFKLKQLFRKITGYSLDEFRKYKLMTRVAADIIRKPDAPLKSFYGAACYTNYSNFSKALQKQCSCTPSELRTDSWDLDGLPNYNIEPHDD